MIAAPPGPTSRVIGPAWIAVDGANLGDTVARRQVGPAIQANLGQDGLRNQHAGASPTSGWRFKLPSGNFIDP